MRVQQRTDGSLMVDIYYDFSNPQGYDTEIAVVASGDNGATWELACSSSNQTGDVGEDISAGTDKHIVWDFYADNPNMSGSQFKVRVLYYFFDTMTGNDSKVYKTVKIGNQWWMAENLRETEYRNHDGIPEITSSSIWSGRETGARCAYNNNESNGDIYGYLYNWYAVNHSSYIAPSGWHVATDGDWSELDAYLGIWSPVDDPGPIFAGRADMWNNSSIVNSALFNVSGFTAIPGGYRIENGAFLNGYSSAIFWTASVYHSQYNEYGLYVQIWTDIELWYISEHTGCSVRLVKD